MQTLEGTVEVESGRLSFQLLKDIGEAISLSEFKAKMSGLALSDISDALDNADASGGNGGNDEHRGGGSSKKDVYVEGQHQNAGIGVRLYKPGQPAKEKLPHILVHLEKENLHGNIPLKDYLLYRQLSPYLKAIERLVDNYEANMEPGTAEKVDYFLTNIKKYFSGISGKPIEYAHKLWEKLAHPYRRPHTLEASVATREHFRTLAYTYPGKGIVGMTDMSLMTRRQVIHRLGLYGEGEADLLDFMKMDHELEHSRKSYLNEDEIRISIFEKYKNISENSEGEKKERYIKLAQIAHAFLFSSSGSGRLKPLYKGEIEAKDNKSLMPKSSGSLGQHEIREYYRENGAPLPEEEERPTHHAEKYQGAKHEGSEIETVETGQEQTVSTQYQGSKHTSEQHETGG